MVNAVHGTLKILASILSQCLIHITLTSSYTCRLWTHWLLLSRYLQ